MGSYNSDKKNAKFFGLKLSRNTDADIIEWLESQESVQGYLKSLIRADIMKEDGNMMNSNYITMDSFGSDCPTNWEEIANALNEIIDEKGIADDHDACSDLWEAYCNGDLPEVPKATDNE